MVLLRGVNVGGHRSFRPTVLARRLRRLDVVSIGAAGTFVVRRPIPVARLRREFARRLPFASEIVICRGREITALWTSGFFARQPERPGIVRFVTVLARRPRVLPPLPLSLPSRGSWMVRILATRGRLVLGLYRRRMQVIPYLAALDGLFGAPGTSRSWNTIAAITQVLAGTASGPARTR